MIVMAKKDELTREQKIELLKGLGKGIVELATHNKAAGYTLSSLILLALGKTRILSCAAVGTLQGVNTYIAISDVVEEAGDAGFFGIGGMGETIAKGGTSLAIGALWGLECETGRTRYTTIEDKQKALMPSAEHDKPITKHAEEFTKGWLEWPL